MRKKYTRLRRLRLYVKKRTYVFEIMYVRCEVNKKRQFVEIANVENLTLLILTREGKLLVAQNQLYIVSVF